MKKILRVLLLIFGIILLTILLAFLFGKVVDLIGMGSSGFWIGTSEQLNYVVGLFMAYAFSVPFIISIFGHKKKYWPIIVLIVLELLFFYNDLRWIAIVLIVAIIGWLLGEGIIRLYKIFNK